MEGILKCIDDNNNLHEKVKETIRDEVFHGVMVSNIAYMLTKELGESEEYCQQMALAGMVHDIGKIKLSKYLYANKDDTLVIEHMKYVRMHSTFSHNILKREHYPEHIVQSVYHHHENYDGTGYPDKLKGGDIPRGARILRVCDVFSALVSKRSYRDAFDEHTALELMIEEASNYDMEVFLAFMRLIHSDKYTGERMFRVARLPVQEKSVELFAKEAENL